MGLQGISFLNLKHFGLEKIYVTSRFSGCTRRMLVYEGHRSIIVL
jgi:hypothetical protein